ncbi:transferase hexapeptide (six repeat-containing protein) [Cellulomonas sp. KH9]|nr:transferase hexapeptide (six repeat-containing protein) [Cellulomonas sp. KH9]
MARMKRYEELETEDGKVVRYQRHENGGGLVAKGAKVDPTAYVADSAWIDPGAVVEAGASVGKFVWVEPGAVVQERARLGSHVHVGREAVVGRGCRLGLRVDVGAQARLDAGLVVEPEARIADGAHAERSGYPPHVLAA